MPEDPVLPAEPDVPPPGGGAGVPATPAAAAARLDEELAGLARELEEIELLVGQARTEAARHEQKRIQAAERLAGLGGSAPSHDVVEAANQVVTLTRRAAVMEAQLDVLAGKQRTLERYRDSLVQLRDALRTMTAEAGPGDALPAGATAGAEPGAMPGGTAATEPATIPGVGRVVLAAQEDLRRQIARAIHDGPAQSLTNIVLQAQIVERLLDRDPAAARAEVHELTAMVQRTLEDTKTFIFDVRPMVLDDLGLVPTLRRIARDRSRRAQVPVYFESLGSDRRLGMELESAVFRVADDTIVGLLEGRPQGLSVTLDWGDDLVLVVRAEHPDAGGAVEEPRPDMPEALRAMVDERRAQATAAGAAAALPPAVRREIEERAAAAGGRVEVAADGRAVTVRFPLPPAPAPG